MLDVLPLILPYAFQLIGVVFAVIFLLALLVVLLRGAKDINPRDLFTSAGDGGTSLTKFWQNVAYAAATVAFLAINITGNVAGASLEVIWLIYLAVVASNAVLSKWISVKYNRTEERKTDDDWFISRPSPRMQRGYGNRRRDEDGDIETPTNVDNPDG